MYINMHALKRTRTCTLFERETSFCLLLLLSTSAARDSGDLLLSEGGHSLFTFRVVLSTIIREG